MQVSHHIRSDSGIAVDKSLVFLMDEPKVKEEGEPKGKKRKKNKEPVARPKFSKTEIQDCCPNAV